MNNLLLMQEKKKKNSINFLYSVVALKCLCHIKVEQRLVVDGILSQVEAYVHAGLHFNTQSNAIIGQYTFYLTGCRAHEATTCPSHESYAVEYAFQPIALIGINHLTVFCHDYVRRLVAILPLVVAAQVEWSSGKNILVEWHIAKDIFRLGRPGKNFTVAKAFILSVIYLQTIEVIIASQKFVVHHAPEVEIHPLVGIGRNIAAIISQQEADAGVEVLIAVAIAACGFVGRLVYQELGRLRYLVVIDVYLRTGKDVAVSHTEEEPGIELDATVTILARAVAADIVFVSGIPQTVEIGRAHV